MEARLYKNVRLGKNVQIGEFVIIGIPPRGAADGELETVIGDDAVIRSHTVIYAGNKIGNGLQTGHFSMIREHNDIGDDVSIGTGTVIEHHIKIGNHVRIHSQVFVPEFSTIEDGVFLGPNVVLTNAMYPLSPDAKTSLKGPKISAQAKVGANTTILPGIVIGKGALVGAGSVVTKDVAAGDVVVGNPNRVINSVDKLSEYKQR